MLILIAASLETTDQGWESIKKQKNPHTHTRREKKIKKKLAFLLGGEESLANLLSISVPRSQPLTQSPVKNEFFPNEILKEE